MRCGDSWSRCTFESDAVGAVLARPGRGVGSMWTDPLSQREKKEERLAACCIKDSIWGQRASEWASGL